MIRQSICALLALALSLEASDPARRPSPRRSSAPAPVRILRRSSARRRPEDGDADDTALLGLTPGDQPEAPPAWYASGPTQTGRTHEVDMPTMDGVAALCGTEGIRAEGHRVLACYMPRMDLVVVPTPQAWAAERHPALDYPILVGHEWGHARGWRHAGMRGTDPHASLPPVGHEQWAEWYAAGGIAR